MQALFGHGMCCMHRVALCSSTASRTAHRLHLLPVALNALYKPHARYRPGQRPAAARSSSRPVAAVAATVKGRQEQQAPAPRPLLGAEEAFYAEKACTFEDLDINHFVADALKSAGFLRPSRVQELALPHILAGKDVVLAAETGSGKTLAYIAPLASLLNQRATAAAAAAAAAEADGETRGPSKKPLALVLCPNAALCQQVIRLVNSLSGPSGTPLLKACQVSTSSPPPFDPPDVVVTTPGALVTLFNDRGYSYGPQWTADGVSSRAAFVVADEADLLSQGGYVKDLTRLLDAFKAGERRIIEAQVMKELGISDDEFSRLSREVKQACWEGGAAAMIKAGYRHRQKQQEQQHRPLEEEAAPSSSGSSPTASEAVERGTGLASTSGRSSSSSSSSSSGSYGPYFKRQYLFVAATMPSLTKADVGTELQRRFKNAVWVSGDLLHQVKPHVEHHWVKVREDGAEEALVEAVKGDPDYQAGQARVLVFARETASADRFSAVLEQSGIHNVVYHKNISREDRDAALATMADASAGNVVMVSTDAASRGIDLPDITHVIQADFAMTAIEFLHRVGRTARAGKDGKVTSLYGKADAVLADAIKQYIKDGKPIEECFSRNRSFSRKVKRYGKFVPRGQEG